MIHDFNRANMTRISAFVGRSFSENDKKVWHDLRDMFDALKSMGFEYEDGREGQIRPISEKVKEIILRHEIYIGVLTKRYPIWESPLSWHERWLNRLGSYEPKKWTTSEWVIEEIGFAIGKDRKVLLLIEDEVNFPTSHLDGDTQWIRFKRENLSASQTEVSQMILNLISQRVISIAEPASVATTATKSQEQIDPLQEPSLFEKLNTIKDHVLSGNFTEADRIQEEILEAATDTKMRSFFEAYLLSFRARNNDTNALVHLKHKCADDPSDFNAIEALARVYSSFTDFNQAIELLVSHLDSVPIDQRSILTIRASEELCKDGKATQAISLLLESLKKEKDESVRVSLYREIARAAEKANIPVLEEAFLEKVLQIVPTDNETRFRLAYVYSSNDLDSLAAYHYILVVEHTDWPGASNNLGATYGALGLKANEYKLYKTIAEQYPLAKANLAVLYANAGFLSEAEVLVGAILSNSNDDSDAQIGIKRARYAQEEITNSEKTEKEVIDRIADVTKAEREFMCAYAEAYCMPFLDNDKGFYSTAHGEIEIIREQGNLKGDGSFTKNIPRGLLGMLPPVIAIENSQELGMGLGAIRLTTYLLSLSAQLHGQAGTFELIILPSEKPSTLLESSARSIKGLLYFQDNGDVIQFLECDENKRTVVTAQRKR